MLTLHKLDLCDYASCNRMAAHILARYQAVAIKSSKSKRHELSWQPISWPTRTQSSDVPVS